MPQEINISASNKGWTEKYLYYRHLSKRDPAKHQGLANAAAASGISLSPDTLQILQNSIHSPHILSLVSLTENGIWDKELVERRTERIMKIFLGASVKMDIRLIVK